MLSTNSVAFYLAHQGYDLLRQHSFARWHQRQGYTVVVQCLILHTQCLMHGTQHHFFPPGIINTQLVNVSIQTIQITRF